MYPRIIEKLPFHLPLDTWMRHVGNTPTVEIEDGIYAKLEGSNPGGSIKDRALTAICTSSILFMLLRKSWKHHRTTTTTARHHWLTPPTQLTTHHHHHYHPLTHQC